MITKLDSDDDGGDDDNHDDDDDYVNDDEIGIAVVVTAESSWEDRQSHRQVISHPCCGPGPAPTSPDMSQFHNFSSDIQKSQNGSWDIHTFSK